MTTSQQVFRRQIGRLILVPLLVTFLIAGVLELQVHRLTNAQDWVDHTDVVLAQTRLLMRFIIDQETGLRGYLLTHDNHFLQPYHFAETALPGLFEQMRSNIADNSGQQNRLAEIYRSYDQWHSYSQNAVAMVEANNPITASVPFNLTGKQLMDTVRGKIQEFVDAEENLKLVRSRRSERQGKGLQLTLLGLLIVLAATLLNETRGNLRAVDSEYAAVLEHLRKQSSELSESRERLRVTLHSIGDAVIVTDADGKINFLNSVAERLTQQTQEQAIGKPLDEVFKIVSEETRLTTESPFSKVMRLGTIVGLANHTLLIRPDNSEIAIDDIGAPIRNSEGQVFGVVLVFRDVTEQREILAVLRSNEKLAVAGRLSASIAHEIHNPLETVRNLLFLIRKRKESTDEHLITMAELELSRVVQITKNILSLYRESKQVTPIKLSEVVESVSMLLQRRIRDEQITFSSKLLTEAQISAFPAEMRQAVSNLMGNAIDAAGVGGKVEVIVEESQLKDSRPGVALTVSDNGHGIAKENLPKLFRPFFTTKGEQGTGLGLWITHGIVSKHGGFIEVTSKDSGDDRGTTFRVVFPKLGTEARPA
jgi:PAS domain S-box-containing protein